MSTLSAALRDAKQVQFLVELDFGGLVRRYAMRDIVVPYATGTDKFFEAAILQPFSVGSRLDLRSMAYSSQSVTIDLANYGRLQDEETRQKLDGGTGRVYLWAPGLDWSDIEQHGLIYTGTFDKQHHTRDLYRFALRDLSETKFRVIPETAINSGTWGNNVRTTGGYHLENAAIEKPQQMVFGNWTKGVPLQCVDTVNFHYLAHIGKSKAADADYTAGTYDVYYYNGAVDNPGNYVFYPNATDREGNVVAYFAFIADRVTYEPLSCSIQGLYDGSGEITGTAGTLIEHPADIAHYLVKHHSLYGLDELDTESLKTMKSLLPGLKFATLINAKASGADILDRLFRQCLVARRSTKGGKLGVVTLAASSPALGALSWDRHLVGKGETISKTPMDEVVNRVLVHYALNPTTGQYEEQLVRDRTNNALCRESYYDYGEKPEYIFEMPDVHEETTAIALTNRLIELKSQRHDLVEMEVPYWDGIDYREGDAALLTLRDGSSADGSGWSEEKCILIERHFQRHTIKQRWWRVAA